ncbi:MAG: hypothetical protein JWR72_3941 [Flavisolibacter sp.]|jgi:hypothetical protein|nr:hypothetical protein [Flavisolibacter sp.]
MQCNAHSITGNPALEKILLNSSYAVGDSPFVGNGVGPALLSPKSPPSLFFFAAPIIKRTTKKRITINAIAGTTIIYIFYCEFQNGAIHDSSIYVALPFLSQ